MKRTLLLVASVVGVARTGAAVPLPVGCSTIDGSCSFTAASGAAMYATDGGTWSITYACPTLEAPALRCDALSVRKSEDPGVLTYTTGAAANSFSTLDGTTYDVASSGGTVTVISDPVTVPVCAASPVNGGTCTFTTGMNFRNANLVNANGTWELYDNTALTPTGEPRRVAGGSANGQSAPGGMAANHSYTLTSTGITLIVAHGGN